MADVIQCPVCGASNPADQDICQTCQSPLGDPNAEGSIQSGEAPTKKQTAELEPILPQWLREARDAARTSEPQDSSESMPRQAEKSKPAPPVDLLAGLQSQAAQDDEEDVPDWLANITGAQPKSKAEPQPAIPEPATERRVELGSLGDFDQEEEPEESDMPAWLAGIQSTEQQPEKDELTDWLHSASDAQPTQPPEPTPAFDTPLPETPSGDTPDWLRQMAMDADQNTGEPANQAPEGSLDLPSDTPDWLRAMSGSEEKPQTAATPEPQESDSAESEAPDFSFMDVPDWLKGPTESESASPSPDTSPKWLRDDSNIPSGEETPAWLSSEDTVYLPPDPQQESSEGDDLLADLPDWLKAAAPESSIFAQPAEEEPAQEEAAPEPPGASQPAEAFSSTEESSPFENAPAFTPDLEGNDSVNSLFTEMPDWLSTAMEPSASETPSSSPTPITSDDILAPSDLPSWVQAMRPVEPGIAQPSLSSDQTLESRGALAGLQGVLPAVPGFAPTSKPKAYSIKLNANDEQLKHAEILEQILAAETSPVPIESFPALGPSRILRWALAFIMVLMIGLVTGLKMQNFSMPLLAPNEMRDAISVVQSLPPNSALLVAMDYEAARAGEMEAASAAMFDQLMLLKQPNLVFISTNELGSALAERIINGPLAGHSVTYTNLGYLSGGQLGIRAFAQDPNTALGNFAAVILITDNADAARSWIEQTQDLRGTMPFVVVSSAQSAPMIQPYYESRQVSGLISGLYGGSIFEQYNAGRPGTARRYWDAYSLGMLIAMSLVLGGGFWNLALGLRDRAAAREAK